MSRGRNNKLVGQAGEFLVCAELARRGYMATPFAGNVPVFDVLIADEHCRTLPIQVKTSSGTGWPSDARRWMRLEYDSESQRQVYEGPAALAQPDLILVCVSLGDESRKDRFFILTHADLQPSIIEQYTAWIGTHNWRRPRNPESYDCRYNVEQLAPHEDRWDLIESRLIGNSSERDTFTDGRTDARMIDGSYATSE